MISCYADYYCAYDYAYYYYDAIIITYIIILIYTMINEHNDNSDE